MRDEELSRAGEKGIGGRGKREEWREHFKVKTISPRDTKPGSNRHLEVCECISREVWVGGADMGTTTESQRQARPAGRQSSMEPWETLKCLKRKERTRNQDKRCSRREGQEGGRGPAAKEAQPCGSQQTPRCTARATFVMLGGGTGGSRETHMLRTTLLGGLLLTRKKEHGEMEAGLSRGQGVIRTGL